MIRAAIAGLGRWGRNLVEAAADHPRLKIVRAVEPDMTAAKEFCARHDLDLTADLDAVLADDTIGAVLLATPHSLHPAQVIACAAARKQIFCEKPLALTYADAARMFGACRAAGVILAVGHNRRFWPSIRALRETLASGQLGEILHVEGHNSNENSQKITSGWRLSPEESPGGGLTGAGLHVLDAFVSSDRSTGSMPGYIRARSVHRQSIRPWWRSILPMASPAPLPPCAPRRFTGAFTCSGRKPPPRCWMKRP